MHENLVKMAAVYCRFSSDNQREESIEAQLRAIEEYCNRQKIIIVATFCDRAKSATTDDRPEFLKMISDSKERKFDYVIVHKLDRFARNRYDSAYYKRELRKNGVTLRSVLEQMDDSPESIILESVLEGMSEYYSKNLAREVRKGMKENALKCMSTGGIPPLGFKINPQTRKFEIEENEAKAVKLIFESVVDGVGYSEIIHELNNRGYKTKAGKPFGKNSIHEILRNEKYRGVYIFNRSAEKDYSGKRNNHQSKNEDDIIRIEDGMPRIIDDKTFEAVTKIITSRAKLRDANPAAKEDYILAGKILCGECGAAYTGNRKRSGRNKNLHITYRCSGRNRKVSVDCGNKEIRREYLEHFVLNELMKIIFDDERIPELTDSCNDYANSSDAAAAEILISLKTNLKTITGKIDNLVSVIANTANASLITALEKLEVERNGIVEEIAKKENRMSCKNITENDVRSAYKKARALYLSGDLDERRQLINLYLNRIVIFKEHVEVYINTLPRKLATEQENTGHSEPVTGDTPSPKWAVGSVCGGGEGS